MTGRLARRAAGLAGTLLVVGTIVFLVFQVLPGDPAQIVLGTEATAEALAQLRAELGLDRPVAARYLHWLGGVARGDLGRSLSYRRPVVDLVRERLPVTIPLALLAMAFTTAGSILLGVTAAVRRGQGVDLAVLTLTQLGLAVPAFWLGMILIIVFSLLWPVLPAGGFPGWEAGAGRALSHLVLPAIALAAARVAVMSRLVRGSLLDVLTRDYVRTAWAKGLPERRVVYGHALRNAFIPPLTMLGLQLGALLAGSVVVEQVFSLPGVGRLLLHAISSRDLPLVQGTVLLVAVAIVTVNSAVDLLYIKLDPRIGPRP